MPRGDKSSYTSKQKRKAEHIEEGYKQRGVSSKTAEARAWATVNKQDGGGKKASPKRKASSSSKSRSTSSSSASRAASTKGRKATNRQSTTSKSSTRNQTRST